MNEDVDNRFYTDLPIGTLLRSYSDGTIVIRVVDLCGSRQIRGVHHVRNDGDRDRRYDGWTAMLDKKRWSITNTPRKEQRR